MMICAKCAVEMRCTKTGIGADFGGGHIYAGDKFACRECGAEVIRTVPEPHYDPLHNYHDEFLTMRSNSHEH